MEVVERSPFAGISPGHHGIQRGSLNPALQDFCVPCLLESFATTIRQFRIGPAWAHQAPYLKKRLDGLFISGGICQPFSTAFPNPSFSGGVAPPFSRLMKKPLGRCRSAGFQPAIPLGSSKAGKMPALQRASRRLFHQPVRAACASPATRDRRYVRCHSTLGDYRHSMPGTPYTLWLRSGCFRAICLRCSGRHDSMR